MADRLDLYFRAHTIPVKPQKEYRTKRRATQPKDALIFRCATTGDERQDLLFGAYICAELEDRSASQRKLVCSTATTIPRNSRVLKRFVKGQRLSNSEPCEEFRRKVFLKYLKAGALIVAYDAPFEISRIAVKWNKSLKTAAGVLVLFPHVQGQENGQDAPQRLRTWAFD